MIAYSMTTWGVRWLAHSCRKLIEICDHLVNSASVNYINGLWRLNGSNHNLFDRTFTERSSTKYSWAKVGNGRNIMQLWLCVVTSYSGRNCGIGIRDRSPTTWSPTIHSAGQTIPLLALIRTLWMPISHVGRGCIHPTKLAEGSNSKWSRDYHLCKRGLQILFYLKALRRLTSRDQT